MTSKATIFSAAPVGSHVYELVPFGRYANREICECEIGGTVTFQDSWRRREFVLVSRARIQVRSSAFTFLCRSLYGQRFGFTELIERWKLTALTEGWGKDCFDTDEVLIVEVADRETLETKEEPHES